LEAGKGTARRVLLYQRQEFALAYGRRIIRTAAREFSRGHALELRGDFAGTSIIR